MEHDRQSGSVVKSIEAGQAQPSRARVGQSSVSGSPPWMIIRRYQKSALATLFGIIVSSLALSYLYSISPKHGGMLNSGWVSAKHQDDGASDPSVPVTSLPPQDPADIPAGFARELTAHSTVSHVGFSRSFTRPIDKVCEDLASLTQGKFKTAHNPIADGQWICSSDILPAGDARASPNVSSVFVWLRGAEHREIDLLRLKLNLTDPASSEAAKSLALDLLKKLHSSLGWDMPRALEDAVRTVKDASFDKYGISYQIIREWSSLPRLNVIIRAHDRSGIVSTDTFALGATSATLHTQASRGSAGLLKPSFSLPVKRDVKAQFGTEPIENLLE